MSSEIRLPGRGPVLTLGFPENLWLRDDHLLCVQQATFVERYQRFYYRDIESISVSQTSAMRTWNIVFGLPCFLGILLYLLGQHWGVTAFTVALGLALMAVNTLRGPTCVTIIRTRLNTRRLTSLCRQTTAHRALAMLTPKILTAQQTDAHAAPATSAPPPIDSEAVALDSAPAQDRPPAHSSPTESAAASPLPLPPPLPDVPTGGLRWHNALAVLTALLALLSLNTALYPCWPLIVALPVLVMCATVVCVPALIAQRHRAVVPGIRKACWSLSTFLFVTGYAFLTVGSAVSGAHMEDGGATRSILAETAAGLEGSLAARGTLLAYAAACAALTAWLATGIRSMRRT